LVAAREVGERHQGRVRVCPQRFLARSCSPPALCPPLSAPITCSPVLLSDLARSGQIAGFTSRFSQRIRARFEGLVGSSMANSWQQRAFACVVLLLLRVGEERPCWPGLGCLACASAPVPPPRSTRPLPFDSPFVLLPPPPDRLALSSRLTHHRPLHKMLLLRSFSAGLGASRSLLATATAAVATRSSLSSPLSLRHWSDSPAGGSPFNEDSSANKSFGNFGNQQSGEKPDWDAIMAAKEARIEKAVQLWSEGKLFSEIAPELGYVRGSLSLETRAARPASSEPSPTGLTPCARPFLPSSPAAALLARLPPDSYEKPLSIGTIREYLFGRARKDEDFANSLRENWERVVWESGALGDRPLVRTDGRSVRR